VNLMASLAEFEHDILRDRVKSGIAPRVGNISRPDTPSGRSHESRVVQDYGQRDPQAAQTKDGKKHARILDRGRDTACGGRFLLVLDGPLGDVLGNVAGVLSNPADHYRVVLLSFQP
jgi:hypothetical protein